MKLISTIVDIFYGVYNSGQMGSLALGSRVDQKWCAWSLSTTYTREHELNRRARLDKGEQERYVYTAMLLSAYSG